MTLDRLKKSPVVSGHRKTAFRLRIHSKRGIGVARVQRTAQLMRQGTRECQPI